MYLYIHIEIIHTLYYTCIYVIFFLCNSYTLALSAPFGNHICIYMYIYTRMLLYTVPISRFYNTLYLLIYTYIVKCVIVINFNDRWAIISDRFNISFHIYIMMSCKIIISYILLHIIYIHINKYSHLKYFSLILLY